MFQIISTLALEVPTFLHNIDECKLWLPIFRSDGFLCACELALMHRGCLPVSEVGDASVLTEECDVRMPIEESGARMSHTYCMDVGRLGSVPLVSHRPGAYGLLLLAVYVWWKTGLLVSCDAGGGGGGGGGG